MTASLGNTAPGTPFATGVDEFVYPQMIGYALRAPTTQDVYNPGTRWQNNSVNPAVQYYTVGAGLWYQQANTAFGVSSVTGTANQITASPTTGDVILSIPSTFIAPGSIASTTTLTAGTGITSTTGNIVAASGNISATLGSVDAGTSVTAGTTITAGTGITSTLGDITASAGNLVATLGNLNLNGAASKININAGTAASASVGTSAAMIGGVVTITSTAITASSKIQYSRRTLGTAMGNISITAQAGGSVELTSDEATETSTFDYLIIN